MSNTTSTSNPIPTQTSAPSSSSTPSPTPTTSTNPGSPSVPTTSLTSVTSPTSLTSDPTPSTSTTQPTTSLTTSTQPTTPTILTVPTSTTGQTQQIITITPSGPDGTSVILITRTSTSTAAPIPPTDSTGTSSSSTTSQTLATPTGGSSSGGLSDSGRIAIEVVVPIVAVALILLAGLFFWKKRKQRKDAEELRRKEVEEYGYNPNDDPTLPPVGGVAGGTAGSDGPFEMREDGQGYRGWGATTAAGSSGRKASTTMSSAVPAGVAYSDGTSPTRGPTSDTRSDNPLVDSNGRPLSGESEQLGAMGPAAAGNRNGDIHRGPSNASSSYSVGARSDGSGEGAVPGGAYGQAQYYSGGDNYGGAYGEGQYGSPPRPAEMGGQPIIRDNLARRATRIENPSHFPSQASAGIAQNF